MTWTGFATDLTLTEVVGSPGAGAAAHRPLNFTKPKADTYSTEDMLPARPRTGLGTILVTIVVLFFFAVSLINKLKSPPVAPAAPVPATQPNVTAESKAEKPAPPSPAKSSTARPKKEKSVKAAAAPSARENPPVEDDAGDTGDMSLEQFRKLSGKI